MAEIVNLRTARKRKRRTDAEASASESRIRHGRSRAQQAEASLDRGLLDKRLDGHRRTLGDKGSPGSRST